MAKVVIGCLLTSTPRILPGVLTGGELRVPPAESISKMVGECCAEGGKA